MRNVKTSFSNASSENRWYKLTTLVAGLLILFLIYEVFERVFMPWKYHFNKYDFDFIYLAAKAIKMDTDIAHFTNGYIYPPFLAYLFSPFGNYNEIILSGVWRMFCLFLIFINLIFGLKILARAFQLKFTRWQALGVCSLAFILTYQTIRWEIILSQFDFISLTAITFALYFIQTRPAISGAFLGLAAGIKYQSVLFVFLLILRGQWKAILGFMLGLLLAFFLPALKLGWQNNLNYWKSALSGLNHLTNANLYSPGRTVHMPSVYELGNVSITDGIWRVFHDFNLTTYWAGALIFILFTMIFLWVWKYFSHNSIPFLWRNTDNSKQEAALMIIEWSTLIICMLMFSPESGKRHFVLLLNVNLLVAVMLVYNSSFKKSYLWLLVFLHQLGLAFQFHATRSHLNIWDHIGGPGWSLVPELILVIAGGLPFYRNLYGQQSIDKLSTHTPDLLSEI